MFLHTGPPSPPRNLVFNINETALFLEWSPPSDTGGRKDVTYNVLCLRCGVDGQPCESCNSNVRLVPRPVGLTSTSVVVQDFVAHANYTFQIEALNGVSGMGRSTRQLANITVSTEQAGKFWYTISWLILMHNKTFIFCICECGVGVITTNSNSKLYMFEL